jgi:hypothetical protein
MTCPRCKKPVRIWARETDSGLMWLACWPCGLQWRASEKTKAAERVETPT